MTSFEFIAEVLSIYYSGDTLIEILCSKLNIYEWEAKRLLEQIKMKKK
jgi:hypothetical protein